MVLEIQTAEGEPENTPDVLGKKATKPEWRTAVALEELGWSFDFQVTFFGGRTFRGGQIVDFVVDTIPATPLFVDGRYVHGGAGKEESDKLLRATLVSLTGGSLRPPVVFYDDELATLEMAENRTRREFGRRG